MAATTVSAGHTHGSSGRSHAGDNCLGAASIKVSPSVVAPVVDWGMHSENRARLVAALAGTGAAPHNLILVAGGKPAIRHDTDHEDLFRQESNFHWLFGVAEPDFMGTIEVDTGRATLYCPRLPEAYAWWMGDIKTVEQWRARYDVHAVRYVDELPATVAEYAPAEINVLCGFNTDGDRNTVPATFDGIDAYKQETKLLWPTIADLRVFKTPRELEILKYISLVSSEAHLAVMQHCRAGLKEYQLESLFQHWCYYNGGARYLSYTCICAAGHNGSVLHYGHAGEPNNKSIRDGDMCLFDMGSEYHGYGSDITCSFPANGRFTDDQKIIYNAVLGAQHAVMDALRPGVSWVDMHTLAYRTILTHLRDGGLLRGEVDDMMEVNLAATFMPHGLGHFLGIDTHDVGGYPEGLARSTLAGYKSLRTARTLQPNMYLTVEPGVYFINVNLDAAIKDETKARFLNVDVINRFRGFGGVRLEDDVVITATGCENFTHAPRTIEDIEAVFAGKKTQRSELAKFH